jgi:hypothetical protein
MGKLLIVSRLAARDLRYRRGESVVVLTAAGVAGLTAAPVRARARSSIADVLQAEVA